MPATARSDTPSFDEALRSTTIHAWDDFSEIAVPRAIRLEYFSEHGTQLDRLSVWLVKDGGYQELVCDYRTHAARDQPRGWRCWTRPQCTRFVRGLDLIMRNQEAFFKPPDANPCGMVVVRPPTNEERATAAAWMVSTHWLGAELLPAPLMRAASHSRT